MSSKSLDIKTLTHELKDVTADWFQLGVQLGVKPAKLQQILQDCGGKTERCHTEMLNCWLQGDLETSWGKVIEALRKRDHLVLAQKLQRMYMYHSSNRGVQATTTSARNWDDLLNPISRDNIVATQYTYNRCTVDMRDKQIRQEYTCFLLEAKSLLQRSEVSLDDLLFALSNVEESVPNDVRLASNRHSFMHALSATQSPYNYSNVAFLVKAFGGKEGAKLVTKYERKLKPILKKRMTLVNVPGKTKQFQVKVNVSQQWKEQEAVDFRNTLAKLFKRQPQEFVLKSVMGGCIEMTFLIPAGVGTLINSATGRLTTELRKLDIVALRLDGKLIWEHVLHKRRASISEPEVDAQAKKIKLSSVELGQVTPYHLQKNDSGYPRRKLTMRSVGEHQWGHQPNAKSRRVRIFLRVAVFLTVVVLMATCTTLGISTNVNLTGHQCLAAILLISVLMVGIHVAWLRHWSCRTNFIIICCIFFGTGGVKLIVFLYTNYLQFIL